MKQKVLPDRVVTSLIMSGAQASYAATAMEIALAAIDIEIDTVQKAPAGRFTRDYLETLFARRSAMRYVQSKIEAVLP